MDKVYQYYKMLDPRNKTLTTYFDKFLLLLLL